MHHVSPPIWEPAQKAIPDLLPDIMYMNGVEYRPLIGRLRYLHQYKHIDTRRYIVLDDDGHAWSITARMARRVRLRAAIRKLTGGVDWSEFRGSDPEAAAEAAAAVKAVTERRNEPPF
jgi:hypothetical protein